MKKPARGFTLIELLMVIAIIGLLASVVLASLGTAKTKGQAARVQSDVHQWRVALEIYYTKHGYYALPSTGNRTWACLGKYSDSACWTDGNGQPEDTPLVSPTGLDAQMTEVIPALPPGQLVQGTGHTYEGYIYECRTLDANNHCSEYWLYWTINGANASCGSEQGAVINANLQGSNVTECGIDITS